MAKKYNNSFLKDLAQNLYMAKTNTTIPFSLDPSVMSSIDPKLKTKEQFEAFSKAVIPDKTIEDIQNSGVSIPQLGSLALGAAKAHPFKTAGLVGLGAGNIGGLTDNDKFGGQLGGLALGGFGSYLAKANPYAAAMMTMGGGALGSLFDKLRAKKELEEQQGYANAGNPIAMMNRR